MIGTTGGRVVVRHGGRDWFLHPGESITIGRSEECAVRLTDPEISRNACLLRVAPDMVLVLNQSGQKPFVLRPPHGEDRRVAPRGATTSLPHRVFEVVFAGRDDEPVCVGVDARGLVPPAYPD
jgi:hypothetical protein